MNNNKLWLIAGFLCMGMNIDAQVVRFIYMLGSIANLTLVGIHQNALAEQREDVAKFIKQFFDNDQSLPTWKQTEEIWKQTEKILMEAKKESANQYCDPLDAEVEKILTRARKGTLQYDDYIEAELLFQGCKKAKEEKLPAIESWLEGKLRIAHERIGRQMLEDMRK